MHSIYVKASYSLKVHACTCNTVNFRVYPFFDSVSLHLRQSKSTDAKWVDFDQNHGSQVKTSYKSTLADGIDAQTSRTSIVRRICSITYYKTANVSITLPAGSLFLTNCFLRFLDFHVDWARCWISFFSFSAHHFEQLLLLPTAVCVYCILWRIYVRLSTGAFMRSTLLDKVQLKSSNYKYLQSSPTYSYAFRIEQSLSITKRWSGRSLMGCCTQCAHNGKEKQSANEKRTRPKQQKLHASRCHKSICAQQRRRYMYAHTKHESDQIACNRFLSIITITFESFSFAFLLVLTQISVGILKCRFTNAFASASPHTVRRIVSL